MENIDKFIQQDLKPALWSLEKRRLKLMFLMVFSSIFVVLICFVLGKLVGLTAKTAGPLAFTSLLPYLIITEKYKSEIQNKVMRVFTSYFEDFNFAEDECVPNYKLAKSKLFNFNQNISKCCFQGTINNYKTILALTKLKMINQDTLKVDTTFEGVVSMFLTNSFVPNQIVLLTYTKAESLFGLPRCKSFDFPVFCEDENLAQNILTTEIITYFKSLVEKFNTHKISLTFFENTILVAVYDDKMDCFEYKSIYQRIKFNTKMEKLYKTIINLCELNYLRLPQISPQSQADDCSAQE